ncbi:uncharacterized protein LOC112016784 [Quercus suber]|uniref:uncharacterized protein LOC112016784 n=1 Tax=Quercus suber TaxID=58331 RepID=UPI0032DF9353
MGPVTRGYLTYFRLTPTQCASNMFKILGSVDALNEKMGLRLTYHDMNYCYNLQHLKNKSYYMRTRDNRVRLIQCLPESNKGMNEDFLIVSGAWHDGLHCPTIEGTLDPHSYSRHFNLINREDLQKVFRSAAFENEADTKLEPLTRSWEAAEENLEREGEAADFGPAEDDFDVFEQVHQFEEPSGDLGDPRLTEADLLASETSSRLKMGYKKKAQPSLLDLIEGQPGKSKPKLPPRSPKTRPAQTRSASTQSRLPPPPLQTNPPSRHEPADPKQNKDKGKRHLEDKFGPTWEGDDTRRPSKQLRIGSTTQDKQVATSPEVQAWLPAPMLRGAPLRDDSSLRDFRDGEGAYVADAVERCLLLPADMEQLGTMRSKEVFLCLKRYLRMAVQATFRLEEAANDHGKAMDEEREKRLVATRTLKTSEEDLAKARAELKAMTQARDSTLSGLEGAQRQAKTQTKRLGEVEGQLKLAEELIAGLTKKMANAEEAKRVAEWAKGEAERAKFEAEQGREEAWATKEEAEAAAYAAGATETAAAYKSQVPGVCRRYCSETWSEALKQARVEVSSDLCKEESVYYPLVICETAPDGSEAEEAAVETAATPGEGASDAGVTGEPVQGSNPPVVVELSDGSNEDAPQQAAKPSPDARFLLLRG